MSLQERLEAATIKKAMKKKGGTSAELGAQSLKYDEFPVSDEADPKPLSHINGMPAHVKRSWELLSKSIKSVFKRSKWSSMYGHYINVKEWIEK